MLLARAIRRGGEFLFEIAPGKNRFDGRDVSWHAQPSRDSPCR